MLNIKADIKEVTRYLDNLQKKQIPFATSQALNKTAYYVRGKLQQEAKKKLDRPTPFTLRGFKYRKATKQKLWAEVYIDKIQWDYMRWQVQGGTRTKRAKSGEVVPVRIKLNKFGNIPGRWKGKLKKLLDRPDTFVGTIKGVKGIWQRGNIGKSGKFSTTRRRKGGGRSKDIQLLAVLEQRVSYKKRLDFHGTAKRHAQNRFPHEFKRQLARALATAK